MLRFSCNISKTVSAFGICKLQSFSSTERRGDNQCQFATGCVGGQGKGRREGETIIGAEGICSNLTPAFFHYLKWKDERKNYKKKSECSSTTHLSYAMKTTSGLIATAGNGHADILCCWCLCFPYVELCLRRKFMFKWASKKNLPSRPRLQSWPWGHCWARAFARAESCVFNSELAPCSKRTVTHSSLIPWPCRGAFMLGTCILVFT